MVWWQIVLLVVGINWGVPLLAWLYPLIMGLIFKDFVFDGFYGPFVKLRLATKKDTDDPIEPWHANAWRDWSGVGLHWYMCYRRPHPRTVLHEGTHCWQQAICGLMFWIIYFGHMLWILVTQRIKGRPYTKHAYLDCVWERQARKRAGQLADIPPTQWTHGKDDLWPWF